MNGISIMQGRLLPRFNGRYQAHPVGFWQAEFDIACELGFSGIELILDYNDVSENPLMTDSGIKEIKKRTEETGVATPSICADYFMEAPLHRDSTAENSLKILRRLIEISSELSVKDIVIPCVDQSSLKSEIDKKAFINILKDITPLAKEKGVFLNIESDLDAESFKYLLSELDTEVVKVNYDIGNSSSLGYDPEEEFAAYGSLISDLHIKDRPFGSGPVPLGEGDADFEKVFSLLRKNNFQGNITMQAFRGNDYIGDLNYAVSQKEFTEKYIKKYLL